MREQTISRRRDSEVLLGKRGTTSETSCWSMPKLTDMTIVVTAIISVVAVVFSTGCSCNDDSGTSPPPRFTTDPSREDIIQAVRSSVSGKTYVDTKYEQVQETHRCSQVDVDLDPYMPGNPELAKCPYVGATYTTWNTVPKSEMRTCEPLPGPEYGWNVQESGANTWRVSYSGRVWDVERLEGASASVGDYIAISGFKFAIIAHQDC